MPAPAATRVQCRSDTSHRRPPCQYCPGLDWLPSVEVYQSEASSTDSSGGCSVSLEKVHLCDVACVSLSDVARTGVAGPSVVTVLVGFASSTQT